MRSTSLWVALTIAGLLVAITATAGMAAPLTQDATVTTTPTATGFGPTPTPTATLLPPPAGGGRVAVYTLVVRLGPSSDAPPLGGLEYSAEVYPIGRSVNGKWAAINWGDQVGFILAELVVWDSELDFSELPVMMPPVTVTPVSTAETETPQPSAAPTERPSQTTAPSLTPEPSATAAPTEKAPAPTDTPVPAVAANTDAGDTSPEEAEAQPPADLPGREYLPWLAIGVPLALLGWYGWQFAAGERETRRYARQFPLQTCPVCQTGSLSLEESIQRPLGVAHVTRTVRCDTCHSVLRQVHPGVWRYTIDPLANPRLAQEFNGQQFNDAGLNSLWSKARLYEPQTSEAGGDGLTPLTDEEILADLEARIPPPEPDVELDLPADPGGESEAAAEESPQEDAPPGD